MLGVVFLILMQQGFSFNMQSGISRSSTTASFRLYAHFESLSISDSRSSQLKNYIIPAVFSWYEHLLKIKRVDSKLKLSDVSSCGELSVPSSHQTEGVDADLIVYIYDGTNSNNKYVEGKACVLQSGEINYPLAGYLRVDSTYYDLDNLEEGFSYISQQVARILGYDFDLIEYYTEASPIINSELRDESVKLIALTNVLLKAKEHYGCSDMEGLELENSVDEFVWESRVLSEDFMSVLENENYKVMRVASTMSVALFQDTQWFEVDYTYASPHSWGNGKGCEFLENDCLTDSYVPNFSEFCFELSRLELCNYSRMGFNRCQLYRFSGTSKDESLANCPAISLSNSNDLCYNEFWGGGSNDKCENCKCFDNDLSTSGGYQAECIQYVCGETSYSVVIDSEEKECSDGATITFTNLSGSLTCAPFADICQNDMCLFGCLGVGQCVNGRCSCETGYSGLYCENYTCHVDCSSCVGPNANQCLTCNTGTLNTVDNYSFGSCSSSQDEDDSDDNDDGDGNDSSVTCSSICQECSDPDTCTTCRGDAVLVSGKCECVSPFFMNSISGFCTSPEVSSCDSNCLTCKDDDRRYCLTCAGGTIKCIPGWCYCLEND